MGFDTIKNSLLDAQRVLAGFVEDEKNIRLIQRASEVIALSLKQGGKVLSCGNGGSMCDAMHFAEELTGRYRDDRPALPAIAISDSSHISCVANDYGFDAIFSRYVEAHGRKNDVLLAISTSGNSENIIKAIEAAKARDMVVIGLSGKDGGIMNRMCDINICVPWFTYSDRIQEVHIKVIHILINEIENQLFSTEEGN